MGKRIIAYPLKKGGSKWKNRELMHSLRSLEAHWTGGWDEVVLLSSIKPDFLNDNIKFHMAPGYLEALWKAIEVAGPGGHILWMNDDILFLKDTDWDELVKPVRRLGHMSKAEALAFKESDNDWKVRLGQMMCDLHERDLPTWKFSTHTPYWYEADKLKVMMDRYARLGYKVAIENAYYNTYLDEFGHARIRDKYRTGNPNRVIPQDPRHLRFLNLVDRGLTKWMKGFIRGRFYLPCSFETNYEQVEELPQYVHDMEDDFEECGEPPDGGTSERGD